MVDFKFNMYQVVYNQKNQKKGRIIQRNRVIDTNYYLVRMEENADKVWLVESDLDDKSLNDKLFDNAFGFNAGAGAGVIAKSPISNAKINDLSVTPNQTIKFKSLTGMEAVDEIVYINEKLSKLKKDLEKDISRYTKTLIHKEIDKLTEEHDRIAKQLSYVKITYQEVK
jgi:hypothetical protein